MNKWGQATEDPIKCLNNELHIVVPDMFQAATNFDYLKIIPRDQNCFAGAWKGVAINQNQFSEGGEKHQDWQDSTRVINFAIPYRNFKESNVVLYQLKRWIEVKKGEVYVFIEIFIRRSAGLVTEG